MSMEPTTPVTASWQDGLDAVLAARLARRARDPGVVSLAIARRIVGWVEYFQSRLPLMSSVMRRQGVSPREPGEALPIVHARWGARSEGVAGAVTTRTSTIERIERVIVLGERLGSSSGASAGERETGRAATAAVTATDRVSPRLVVTETAPPEARLAPRRDEPTRREVANPSTAPEALQAPVVVAMAVRGAAHDPISGGPTPLTSPSDEPSVSAKGTRAAGEQTANLPHAAAPRGEAPREIESPQSVSRPRASGAPPVGLPSHLRDTTSRSRSGYGLEPSKGVLGAAGEIESSPREALPRASARAAAGREIANLDMPSARAAAREPSSQGAGAGSIDALSVAPTAPAPIPRSLPSSPALSISTVQAEPGSASPREARSVALVEGDDRRGAAPKRARVRPISTAARPSGEAVSPERVFVLPRPYRGESVSPGAPVMASPKVVVSAAVETPSVMSRGERRGEGVDEGGVTSPVDTHARRARNGTLEGGRGEEIPLGARPKSAGSARGIPLLRVTPLPPRAAAFGAAAPAEALPLSAPRWQRAGRGAELEPPADSHAPPRPRGVDPSAMPLVVAPRLEANAAATGPRAASVQSTLAAPEWTTSAPPSPPLGASAPRAHTAPPKVEVDVDALVEKVQKKLLRRIAAERDRKGGLL